MAVVKSVRRVLEILEYLDDRRGPATVTDIARALGYPQSSTSALLGSLVALGYCENDPARRTYMPTARVMLLGSWLDAPLTEHGAVIRMLHDVADRTGEHVLLATLIGVQVRFIYTVAARHRGRPRIRTGTIRPLGRSGAGNLFLAVRSDAQIASLVRRVNAEEPDQRSRIQPAQLRAEIAETRRLGYSVALDKMAPGIGGVNVLLPKLGGNAAMAVAISSPSDVIEANHAALFATIRDCVRRHLNTGLPKLGP